MTFLEIQKSVFQAEALKKVKEKECADTEALLISLEQKLEAQQQAQALIQYVAQETQEQLRVSLEDIVQSALDICFPGEYKFLLNYVKKRDRTECEIMVEKDGNLMNPKFSNGGGLVDVISFGLRIACLCLSTKDKVLFLDEPFKWLSAAKVPLMCNLIQELSHKLDIQIVLVTHDEEFMAIADKKFVVTQKDGKSKVEVC